MLQRRPTVLVVEDEAAIAETLLYALRTEGFDVLWCTTGADALESLRAGPVALILLDVGLPDGSGFDVCRRIRAGSDVPVIFLTARSEAVDRIVGLELGADDYVAKPFSPREVTARVRAVLRRAPPASAATTCGTDARDSCNGAWRHDPECCQITFRGRALDLTRNEYHLLAVLLRAPGRVFSREQLMELAWPDPGAAGDRTVDAHIKTLRAKLRVAAPDEDPIKTHRGLGYSLRGDK